MLPSPESLLQYFEPSQLPRDVQLIGSWFFDLATRWPPATRRSAARHTMTSFWKWAAIAAVLGVAVAALVAMVVNK